MIATSLSSCKAPGLRSPRAAPRRRPQLATRAMLSPQLISQIADAAPGSVDAPVGAIVVGAIVVTALSFGISAGLKSGTDASIEMQTRDKSKFNKYDK